MVRIGLLPLKEKKFWEKQDYSHKKTFGSFDVSQLPTKYSLASEILNQGSSYKCTAYASCAIQASQHGKKFDPDWFYFQEGIVNGEHSETGYDLRTPMKTGCKKGFRVLGVKDSENEYKEYNYFRVDDPLNSTDLFDDIRVAMWLAKEEKKCANAGVDWQSSWSSIITTIGNQSGGHDIDISGWDTIDGVPYLEIQNSYGTSFGKDGLNYISREVVNNMFKYGVFMWRSPQETVKTMSRLVALLVQLRDIYIQLLKLCGLK
jgi:hypothetical protein